MIAGARARRAGERDLADLRMTHEFVAGRASVALNHVEDAGGHAGLDSQFREAQHGKRRHLRRLEDDRVARGERGATSTKPSRAGKFHGAMAPITPYGSAIVMPR